MSVKDKGVERWRHIIFCHLPEKSEKKIQNFLMLINIGPQLELSDSLLLELMNPQKHIIILPKDQPYRGKEALCE